MPSTNARLPVHHPPRTSRRGHPERSVPRFCLCAKRRDAQPKDLSSLSTAPRPSPMTAVSFL